MWMESLCQSSQLIKELDDIKLFLEDRGCTNEANAVSSAVDMVASVHIASMKQTTLWDFLRCILRLRSRKFYCMAKNLSNRSLQ